MTNRVLTHDEKKAAEAAFKGLPLDPLWSSSAQSVYWGMLQAMPEASVPLVESDPDMPAQPERSEPIMSENTTGEPASQLGSKATENSSTPAVPWTDNQPSATREQAMRAGLLYDITSQAQEMGLQVPVGMTKPLWDFGITGCETLEEDQYSGRVRDILIALRLHLSRSSVVAPFSQFPVLLAFPPNPIPQVFMVCAIIQADAPKRHILTLLLPSELAVKLSSKAN